MNAFQQTANHMTYIKWLFKQTKPLYKKRRLWWIGSSKIPTFVAFNKTVWKGCLIGNVCYSNFGKISKKMWCGLILFQLDLSYVSVKHSFYSQKPQNVTSRRLRKSHWSWKNKMSWNRLSFYCCTLAFEAST